MYGTGPDQQENSHSSGDDIFGMMETKRELVICRTTRSAERESGGYNFEGAETYMRKLRLGPAIGLFAVPLHAPA